MAYGSSLAVVNARAANTVGRILKGARPADILVEQPSQFELTLNAKALKALELPLSAAFLARVDRVIE